MNTAWEWFKAAFIPVDSVFFTIATAGGTNDRRRLAEEAR